MDYIIEASKLSGEIAVYGAKNCALALLGASVLTQNEIVLTNCPHIDDVNNMLAILKAMGKKVVVHESAVSISGHLTTTSIPRGLAKLLRGSSLLLGSTLARYGKVSLPMTGGCSIGKRPIDIHLEGLKKLGVSVQFEGDSINCYGIPKGGEFVLRLKSVGATENLICACVLAKGQSILLNCATEPEVVALEHMLIAMGAKIQGVGTSVLQITGVENLGGVQFCVIPDRIVCATYLSCALASGGDVTVTSCEPMHMDAFIKAIEDSCHLDIYSNAIRLRSKANICGIKNIQTGPYPLFATDMQSLLLSLASLSYGDVTILKETMFENRLTRQCSQLQKMGADIVCENNIAIIVGGKLHGTNVMAYDLRGGAGLVVAAMAATGKTQISGIENVNRGYCQLAKNLQLLGAKITCK